MLDDRASPRRTGDVLFIPRGHVHQFANLDTQDARELSVITPGRLGAEDIHNRRGCECWRATECRTIMEVMRRHGLRPVLPTT